MEGMAVLIGYLLVLAGMLFALCRTCRRPTAKKWLLLFLTETVAICASYGLMRMFDGMTGAGMFAGIAYFAETLYSLGAIFLFAGVLLISAIAAGIVWLRRK